MEEKKTIKEHVRDHLILYSLFGTAAVAGITVVIVRSIDSQHIGRGISVSADRGISVIADRSVVTTNVSLISSRRKGAPSWVIRCKETGEIFTSQLAAANEMKLSPSEVSKHLNGRLDHVRGNTFERICISG